MDFTHCTHCFKTIDEDENCCIVRKHGINYMFCEHCSSFAVNVFMKWYEEFVPLMPRKQNKSFYLVKYPSLKIDYLVED